MHYITPQETIKQTNTVINKVFVVLCMYMYMTYSLFVFFLFHSPLFLLFAEYLIFYRMFFTVPLKQKRVHDSTGSRENDGSVECVNVQYVLSLMLHAVLLQFIPFPDTVQETQCCRTQGEFVSFLLLSPCVLLQCTLTNQAVVYWYQNTCFILIHAQYMLCFE